MKLVKTLSLALVATSLMGSMAMAEEMDYMSEQIHNEIQMGKVNATMENSKQEAIQDLIAIRADVSRLVGRVKSIRAKSDLRSIDGTLKATIIDAQNLDSSDDSTSAKLDAALNSAEALRAEARAIAKRK